MEKQIKQISFSKVTYRDIQDAVTIKQLVDDSKFEEWFAYKYKISEADSLFLNDLIKIHRLFLPSYNEKQLSAKFISPVLNRVNFYTETVKDWYGYSLNAIINGYEFSGQTDFMVATGVKLPQKPYFFVQEFKQSKSTTDPEDQLLAEMLVAMQKNNDKILQGGFIIGRHWNFVILEKIKENNYQYYVSKSFDCLDTEDLKQIFIILQAVKHKFCK